MKKSISAIALAATVGFSISCGSPEVSAGKEIIHEAEFQRLWEQNGERWAKEDEEIQAKLAELEKKFGKKPSIIHILWDDMRPSRIRIADGGQGHQSRGSTWPPATGCCVS